MADDRRDRGHRPLDVRRQGRQPARVDRDDDHGGVQVAGRGGDGGDPAVAEHEVVDDGVGQDRDLARLQARREGRPEPGHAAGHRPRTEPLLDVRHHAQPGGHVAQVVPLGDEPVPGDQPQPLVLEVLLQPLVEHLAAVQQRRQRAGEVVAVPGHLEVAAAQRLPLVLVRRDVVHPPLAEPRAEPVEGRDLGGPRSAGKLDGRTVLEAVLADLRKRLEVELAFHRPAGLAEQVADDRGQQGRRRAGVPGEPVLRLERQRTTHATTSAPRGSRRGRAWRAARPTPAPRSHHPQPRPAPWRAPYGAVLVSAGRAPPRPAARPRRTRG